MTRLAVGDDLLSPDALSDPYTYFGQLRELDPVHWNELHRSWIVTRYEDVMAGYKDGRLSSDRVVPHFEARLSAPEREEMEPVLRTLSRWMVFNDPPEHGRLRAITRDAFSPRTVEAMRPRVKAVVEDLLGGLEGKATADFVADFAFPLPAIVIAELLGVPPGDRELFKSWSTDLKALVFGALDDGQRHQRARQAIDALSAYFADLVAHYRRRPGDNLISSFLVPEAGRPPVDAGELIPMLILLLFAGHETTTNLLANGLLALLRNPDQLDRLRQEPSAMTSAVEELLRFDGPAKLSVRWVASDLEMRGTRIAKGDRLLLVNASANRDPRRFADPDRLDLGRTDNAHLAFGYGRHYCLGASLARLEASLAFSTITERLPRIQLQADGELRWQPTILGRELEQLPIRLS